MFSFRYFYCHDNAPLIPLLALCLSLAWFFRSLRSCCCPTDLSIKKMQSEPEGLPHGIGKQEGTSMAFKAAAGTVWIVLYYNSNALLQCLDVWARSLPGCHSFPSVFLEAELSLLPFGFSLYARATLSLLTCVLSRYSHLCLETLGCWGSEEDFEHSSNWFFFAF